MGELRITKMSTEEAKQNIGNLVMSHDAGRKLIRSVGLAHGPYRILQVTKAGLVILEGREEFRIPPSLIDLVDIPAKAGYDGL